MNDLAELRRNYAMGALTRTTVAADPLTQLRRWLDEAIEAQVPEPNAMTLATATPDGEPDARVVLLKGIEDEALVFYTNYRSAKGRQLDINPRAALVFMWLELERQVRVQGTVERVSVEASDAYFRLRPHGSRIGAAASCQSEVVASRTELEGRFHALAERYPEGSEVPRPRHWGGYRVLPRTLEFWQGRRSRLHDRIRYRREGTGWVLDRLEP